MTAANHERELPEDTIVDRIAVEVAAAGLRDVRLTPTERRYAAALIFLAHGSTNLVCARLRVSAPEAARLVAAAIQIAA